MRRFDGANRPEQPVILDPLGLDGTAKAGRVDEADGPPIHLHDRVDGVARGTGLLVDHGPFLPHQPVEQRRLPHVRPSHQGEPGLMLDFSSRSLGQDVKDPVEQVTAPPALQGGHLDRLSKPQTVELGAQRLTALRVDLVGHQEHGLGARAQLGGQDRVLLLDPRGDVDNQEDEIGRRHRRFRLPDDALFDPPRLAGEAPRVDDQEGSAAPLHGRLHPVAGDPRHLVRDGDPPAEQTVDERRLPDVLPAHHGHPGGRRITRHRRPSRSAMGCRRSLRR